MASCEGCGTEADGLEVLLCMDCDAQVCDACSFDGPEGTCCERCGQARNTKVDGRLG